MSIVSYIGELSEKMSSDPKLIPYVLPLIDGCRILDVACGKGKWGYLIKVDFWYTSAGRFPIRKELDFLIGIDIFPTYLKFIKKHQIYDNLVLCDALYLPFRNNIFDVSLALEVLEHIKKSKGYKLLREMERVSSKSTIITTPIDPTGFFSQGVKDKNVYQRHISRWNDKELRSIGYVVLGHSFPLEKLLELVSSLFPKLIGILPQIPFCFIARKELK